MTETTDTRNARRHGKVFARFAATLALALLPLLPGTAEAAKQASLVIDAQTGRVLHEDQADRLIYPASLTKMMTLYMVFDALERGALAWDTPMRVSAHAAGQAPTKLGLEPGDSLLVREAVPAMVVKSANDAAVVVAEHLGGGSEHEFALAMTAKARALGMDRSTFRNASGLPHPGQLSTARDMAKLGLALQRHFPQHFRQFARTEFTFRGETVHTHNKLLNSYDGVDGIKTGYIRASGFNLVSSAHRDGRALIGVVLGGNSPNQRNGQMARLLDKGFSKLAGHWGQEDEENIITRVAAAEAGDMVEPQGDYEEPAVAPAQAKKARPQVVAAKPAPKAIAKPAKGRDDGDDEMRTILGGTGGAWGVQVGAFGSPAQARDAARKALLKVAAVTGGGDVHVEPLKQKSGKTVYRARILGMEKDHASKACKVLAQTKTDCLELRGPAPQLASTAK